MRFARTSRAALLGILGSTCTPPPAPLRELRLTDQRFTEDTLFEVDRLVLTAGAHVRIEDAALLMIRTRELVIEGDARLDGNGAAGSTPEVWTSRAAGLDCEAADRDWSAATPQRDANARGGAGGPGGHLELRYRFVTEAGGSLSTVRIETAGGRGGRGGLYRCGCWAIDPAHRGHVMYGPDGPDGAPGSSRVVYEPELP
jgi:hypothetical protein